MKSYVAPDPFVMPTRCDANVMPTQRDANSPRVESVYINADLTPTEAKLAFEERMRRRARGNKSQPPRKGAFAMDVVEDTDAGTNVTGGSSADVESHD